MDNEKQKMLVMLPQEMSEEKFVDLVMRIQALNTIDEQNVYDDKYTISERISRLSCESITPVEDIKYIVARARESANLASRREIECIEKECTKVALL